MLSGARVWQQFLSRLFGHWAGRRRKQYCCPLWADKDAYTHAYLLATGILSGESLQSRKQETLGESLGGQPADQV
jgi:hypothetical protein